MNAKICQCSMWLQTEIHGQIGLIYQPQGFVEFGLVFLSFFLSFGLSVVDVSDELFSGQVLVETGVRAQIHILFDFINHIHQKYYLVCTFLTS